MRPRAFAVPGRSVVNVPTRWAPLGAAVIVATMATAAHGSATTTPTRVRQTPAHGSTACASLLPNPTAKPAHGTLSAKIDGALWTATCITVNTAPGMGLVGFGGSDNQASPTGVGMGFGAWSMVGSYQVSNPQMGINGLLTIGKGAWQSAAATGGTGTLTFTQSTPNSVVGKFSFALKPMTLVNLVGNTATGPKTITDGAFSITF